MSEQRLIDIDALKEKEQYIPCGNGLLFHGVTAATIDAMPTIDPDTLPIVRELREKLERVTAERDAAKRDIEKAMELSEHELPGMLCEFCKKNDTCIMCDGAEWRGLVAENATTDCLDGDHHD